jgi:hemolysin activation/secretion protein
MDFVDQTTVYPGGQGPLADDALRVLWVRTDASMLASDRPFMGDLVSTEADISVQGRKGLEVLGATEAGATDVSRPGGRADAWVVRAEGHASVRLAPLDTPFLPITFSTHVFGQWADRPLLSYEQQAIGNLSIGRGYDPNAAAGDRVAAAEFKISVGPMKLSRALQVSPYIFEDVARVGYLEAAETDVTLRSVGGGFEFRIPYDRLGDAVRIDAGYAKPLDRPVPSAANKPPPEYLVQIIVAH